MCSNQTKSSSSEVVLTSCSVSLLTPAQPVTRCRDVMSRDVRVCAGGSGAGARLCASGSRQTPVAAGVAAEGSHSAERAAGAAAGEAGGRSGEGGHQGGAGGGDQGGAEAGS